MDFHFEQTHRFITFLKLLFQKSRRQEVKEIQMQAVDQETKVWA